MYVCVFYFCYRVIFNCLFSIEQFRVCVERLFTAVRLKKLCLFLSSFILRVCVCLLPNDVASIAAGGCKDRFQR